MVEPRPSWYTIRKNNADVSRKFSRVVLPGVVFLNIYLSVKWLLCWNRFGKKENSLSLSFLKSISWIYDMAYLKRFNINRQEKATSINSLLFVYFSPRSCLYNLFSEGFSTQTDGQLAPWNPLDGSLFKHIQRFLFSGTYSMSQKSSGGVVVVILSWTFQSFCVTFIDRRLLI